MKTLAKGIEFSTQMTLHAKLSYQERLVWLYINSVTQKLRVRSGICAMKFLCRGQKVYTRHCRACSDTDKFAIVGTDLWTGGLTTWVYGRAGLEKWLLIV